MTRREQYTAYSRTSDGDTVKINIPSQFTLGTTADITSTIQDVEEKAISLTVNSRGSGV